MSSGGNTHDRDVGDDSSQGAPGPSESGLDLEELLNPGEQRRFRRLCIETSVEDLQQLGEVVEFHLGQVRENAGPATDVETAGLVAEAIQKLLTLAPDLNDRERALARGGVEYFLLNDDASEDLHDALGFDDDARVLNSVFDRIDRPEMKVKPLS